MQKVYLVIQQRDYDFDYEIVGAFFNKEDAVIYKINKDAQYIDDKMSGIDITIQDIEVV